MKVTYLGSPSPPVCPFNTVVDQKVGTAAATLRLGPYAEAKPSSEEPGSRSCECDATPNGATDSRLQGRVSSASSEEHRSDPGALDRDRAVAENRVGSRLRCETCSFGSGSGNEAGKSRRASQKGSTGHREVGFGSDSSGFVQRPAVHGVCSVSYSSPGALCLLSYFHNRFPFNPSFWCLDTVASLLTCHVP